jgi:RND family efflux transporter MFP subunit
MKQSSSVIRKILPVLIIAAGVAIMLLMVKNSPGQKRAIQEDRGILVEAVNAAAVDTNAIVRSTATVSAAREISLIPQVSGMVTEVSENFVAGGFFRGGDLLFRIDPNDYELELERAKSLRAKAEYELQTIKSRAEIAKREWELMKNESLGKPNPLALYGPQLKNAEAALASAEASVELARINVSRTELRAPFDLKVSAENIERGQYVRAGTEVSRLVGTETAEVIVSLSSEELKWIDLPQPGGKVIGSEAVVSMGSGGGRARWRGRVVRSLGEINPRSRTVSVVVEVKDPYGLESDNQAAPLLLGSFVEVEIVGRALENVYVLPRTALRENSSVWSMDDEGLLRIKKIDVARSDRERIIVASGLSDGESIVVTGISGASEGMRLRKEEAK